MKHLCNVRLQMLLHVLFPGYMGFFPRLKRSRYYFSCRLFIGQFSNMTNLVYQDFLVEGFHQIVISARLKGIFCHLFSTYCTKYNECRIFQESMLAFHFFHHGYTVNFRHYQIQQYNVRRCVNNHVNGISAIVCLSNYR